MSAGSTQYYPKPLFLQITIKVAYVYCTSEETPVHTTKKGQKEKKNPINKKNLQDNDIPGIAVKQGSTLIDTSHH